MKSRMTTEAAIEQYFFVVSVVALILEREFEDDILR